jgi:sulfhydrogenase subunit beta (sulfur reductase)
MSKVKSNKNPLWVVERKDLQSLFESLIKKQYQILGPTVDGNAVIYDEITSIEELPIGIIDHQEGGSYRLEKTDKETLFGYVVGPHTWKKYLYPAEQKLFEAERHGHGFKVVENNGAPIKRAFIGARPCELKAIAIHDKILLDGPYLDVSYKQNRDNIFIVAVNCTRAGETCFCASMNTGPKAENGFDLALTEILENGRHYFLIEEGSKAGQKILADVPKTEAGETEINSTEKALDKAAKNMGRGLDTDGIKELLYRNLENPCWEAVAKRCLNCGNCTMVCPTCFCINIKDYTDLNGQKAERRRKWDSCFTLEHSYIYGGSIRTSAMARYRQWLTHKLAGWIDQFGTSGCVGCGRCITWCPVGIDITEEVNAIRKSEGKNKQSVNTKD